MAEDSLFKFTIEMADKILNGLSTKGFTIADGFSETAFEKLQIDLNIVFPEDLKVLLKQGVPTDTDSHFPNWHENPIKIMYEKNSYINERFKFDIEQEQYWCDAFGDKPSKLTEAVEQALKAIAKWPPLIPIYSHRFMPSYPISAGNPVISVWQPIDTVYYGHNIVDYFNNEFGLSLKTSKFSYPLPVPYWGKAFFESEQS